MPYIIVEYDFDPPATEEILAQWSSALDPCTSIRQVNRLRSVLSLDRRRGYCEFEAPDAETLREAYRSAHVPFRTVWSAQLFDFAPPTAPTGGR